MNRYQKEINRLAKGCLIADNGDYPFRGFRKGIRAWNKKHKMIKNIDKRGNR